MFGCISYAFERMSFEPIMLAFEYRPFEPIMLAFEPFIIEFLEFKGTYLCEFTYLTTCVFFEFSTLIVVVLSFVAGTNLV